MVENHLWIDLQKFTQNKSLKKHSYNDLQKITHKKSFKTHQKNQIPFKFTKWFKFGGATLIRIKSQLSTSRLPSMDCQYNMILLAFSFILFNLVEERRNNSLLSQCNNISRLKQKPIPKIYRICSTLLNKDYLVHTPSSKNMPHRKHQCVQDI